MANEIRIRKPHDKVIERMLNHGIVEVPPGVGLYFSRMKKDLADVAIIRPRRRDVFELIRGVDAIKRSGESHKHVKYRRTGKKWGDIL